MEFKTLDLESEGDADAFVAKAADRLRAGEILIHPTSTVYGLGALPGDSDREINRLKGRPPDAPLIRLAAGLGAVRALPGVHWDDRAERLASALWPGSLTLVVDDGSEHGIAVRVDGHPLMRAILEAAGTSMSSTSLNRAGEEPALTVERARAAAAELPASRLPATLLDAGDPPGKAPSTIVSLLGRRPRVLREGAVSVEQIETALGEAERPRRLLFVCTGNTCRSPMAEAIARSEARERGLAEVESRSAGTFAWAGQPASSLGILVARDRGLDLGGHVSTELNAEALAWADLVLGMDRGHVESARRLLPGVRAELLTEGLPAGHAEQGRPVPDPIGGERETYEATFDLLDAAVKALFDRLEAG